jgi:hypothetical protein
MRVRQQAHQYREACTSNEKGLALDPKALTPVLSQKSPDSILSPGGHVWCKKGLLYRYCVSIVLYSKYRTELSVTDTDR